MHTPPPTEVPPGIIAEQHVPEMTRQDIFAEPMIGGSNMQGQTTPIAAQPDSPSRANSSMHNQGATEKNEHAFGLRRTTGRTVNVQPVQAFPSTGAPMHGAFSNVRRGQTSEFRQEPLWPSVQQPPWAGRQSYQQPPDAAFGTHFPGPHGTDVSENGYYAKAEPRQPVSQF